MSIESDGKAKEMYCDGCGDVIGEYMEETARENFKALMDQSKEEGWLTTKRQGKWMHFCPHCKEDLE